MNAFNQSIAEFELRRCNSWIRDHRWCLGQLLIDALGKQTDVWAAYQQYSCVCKRHGIWHSQKNFFQALRTTGYEVRYGSIWDVTLADKEILYPKRLEGDLTIADVRRLYGIASGALSCLRRRGIGPPHKLLKTGIHYPREALEKWLDQYALKVIEFEHRETQNLLRLCLDEICEFTTIEVRRTRQTGIEHYMLMCDFKHARIDWNDLFSAVQEWMRAETGGIPLDLRYELKEYLSSMGCRETRIRLGGKRVPYVIGLWFKDSETLSIASHGAR